MTTPRLEIRNIAKSFGFNIRGLNVNLSGTEWEIDPDDDNDGVVDSRDGYPYISLGGRQDSDRDGYPDECDEACIATGLTKDLETILETTAPTTQPATNTSLASGTFIWDTHNWDEETWQ
mgnify:CR=1 FL=1